MALPIGGNDFRNAIFDAERQNGASPQHGRSDPACGTAGVVEGIRPFVRLSSIAVKNERERETAKGVEKMNEKLKEREKEREKKTEREREREVLLL